MSSLADHQRAMAALVVGDDPPDDPHARHVHGTPELDLLREIGTGWQALGLRLHCPLTWRALEGTDRLAAAFDRFARRVGVSEHLHVQSRQFLDDAAGDEDPLVAAVARFERSLAAATDPAAARAPEVVIDWPCEPVALIHALVGGDDPLPTEPRPHRSTAPAATPAILTVWSVQHGPTGPTGPAGQLHSTPGGGSPGT